MKTIKFASIVVLVLFNYSISSAQNKTSKKIEEAREIVEEAGETVKEVDKLFKSVFGKKKKNKQEKEVSKKSQPSNTNTEKTKDISEEKETTLTTQKQKTGSIHPDAVVLNVDKLYPFYNGAAIVQKGSSTALINAKGEFIVPFNTHDFNASSSKNGFFLLHSYDKLSKGRGFVTANGTLIKTESSGEICGDFLYADDGKSINESFFYTNTGKKYRVTGNVSAHERIGNGLIGFGNIGKKGFKNLDDKVVVSPNYQNVYSFYDGIAIVSKKNEFGEIKYGYIDTKGNPITPIQFSRRPQPFSNGLGLVYYKEPQKYSYINKKGEIVFTETSINKFGPFYKGFAQKIIRGRGKAFIMDKSMNQKTVIEFLKDFGIETKNNSGSITFPEYHSIFLDTNSLQVLPFRFYNGEKPQYGYLFIESKKAIYGDFKKVIGVAQNSESHFDKVSGLKLAQWMKNIKSGDVIDGYINENGIFMIIKGEASKW